MARTPIRAACPEQKWGEKIPHFVEVREDNFHFPVERWIVNGEIQGGNVCNCPTAMKERSYYPQRWEEVPLEVYDPAHRLKALDRDRVDAEVLFPNGPGGTFFYDDAEFELDLRAAPTTMRWPNFAR